MTGRHTGAKGAVDGEGQVSGGGTDWKRRVITGAILLIVLVLGYFALAAYIPRWWSQRIGHAVNGQLSTGMLLGFCFGTVFTIVPLGLLYWIMRRSMRWKTRILWLALGLILAAPNLMTMGVAIGGGGGSHAGQRTMDVDAPMFRGATLVGVLFAVLVFVVMVIIYQRRGRAPRAPKTPAAA
jgi:hypothetical protein